jgi:two-component system sensor histidine kinase CpxA
MRTGKLYLKFFLSFLAILVVTELLIFALFHEVVINDFFEVLQKTVEANKATLTELIETRVQSGPADITKNAPLKELIRKAGRIYDARIWIASPDGRILLKSFDGMPPAISPADIVDHNGFLHHEPPGGPVSFFLAFPVRLQDGGTATVSVLMAEKEHQLTIPFALGLSGIGIIIALLILLIYRSISEPLRELRHTALEIAGGDLSHRAEIASRDEIGELAGAFNHMAGIIENMVKTNRELTANISHELRSPLARIRIAEELLQENLGDPAKAEYYLASIREEIGEMDVLIGRFLTLSKLDILEPASRETFDLEDLVSHILEHYAPSLEHKGIRLTLSPSSERLMVDGRPDEILTALGNIMDNAVKYTPEGGEIAIDLGNAEGQARLTVRNTCPVMNTADIGRIFEPFFRAGNASAKGTGLGLAITKKIIERHKGSLKAFPWEQGLSIELTLPLGKSA